MPCALTIVFPPSTINDPAKPLPSTFTAVGIIGPLDPAQKIVKVKAFITIFTGGKPEETPIEMKESRMLVPHNTAKKKGYVRWTTHFKNVVDAKTQVRLTVKAFGKEDGSCVASGSVDFYLTPRGKPLAPAFDWPPTPSYTLTSDEQDYFFCCGPSTLPVVALTFNGMTAADCVWSSDDEYWSGDFYNLGTTPGSSGAGPYPLSVTNTDTTTPTTTDQVKTA